jgi:hypothetical protein
MRIKGRKFTPNPKPINNQVLIGCKSGIEQTGLNHLIQTLEYITLSQGKGKPQKITLFTLNNGKPQ